jgi:hypothetical protein
MRLFGFRLHACLHAPGVACRKTRVVFIDSLCSHASACLLACMHSCVLACLHAPWRCLHNRKGVFIDSCSDLFWGVDSGLPSGLLLSESKPLRWMPWPMCAMKNGASTGMISELQSPAMRLPRKSPRMHLASPVPDRRYIDLRVTDGLTASNAVHSKEGLKQAFDVCLCSTV